VLRRCRGINSVEQNERLQRCACANCRQACYGRSGQCRPAELQAEPASRALVVFDVTGRGHGGGQGGGGQASARGELGRGSRRTADGLESKTRLLRGMLPLAAILTSAAGAILLLGSRAARGYSRLESPHARGASHCDGRADDVAVRCVRVGADAHAASQRPRVPHGAPPSAYACPEAESLCLL
jgi:hypothetical protein